MNWLRQPRQETQTDTAKVEVDAARKAAKKVIDAQFESLFELMQETLKTVTNSSEENRNKNTKEDKL